MLNSYTMTHAGAFSEDTIRFLQEEAAKARSEGRITFVASHAPAFPGGGHMYDSLPLYDPTFNCAGYDPLYGIDRRRERDRFWNILKTNGVAAYFTGHEHNTQVQEVEGVWHVIAGGLTEKLYPLNGAPEDKKTNTILYDGRLQNPRASLRWPWDEKPASYWGWCLVTVDGGRVTMEVRGTDTFPKNPADFKLLKTFTLAPRPGS
jgi:hypothetical protein